MFLNASSKKGVRKTNFERLFYPKIQDNALGMFRLTAVRFQKYSLIFDRYVAKN